MFSSVQEVEARLFSTGYITDQITTTVLYLAAKLNKPILLEGPPGSGKTELAYAVAKMTDADVERLPTDAATARIKRRCGYQIIDRAVSSLPIGRGTFGRFLPCSP